MTEDFPHTLPNDADIYEIVAAFAAAQDAAPDDRALLRRWTQRFPQCADDLMAFAYARFAFGWSLDDPAEDIAEPERAALTDMVAEAKSRGLTSEGFARALRLDAVLLARLNQRLLDVSSIPQALVNSIAQTLDRRVEEVIACLRGGPRLAAGAHYRAKQAPALVAEARPRQTFAEALGASSGLPPEDRAYWQAEVEKGKTLGDE